MADAPRTPFYLGREYDLAAQILLEKRIDYESKDLCTHGVVVGMTGSGKTGLSIALLEEAAIAGIPCIILDPKGDLSNLLLQFEDLPADRFAEWLNPDEAAQKGVSREEYARELADRWRKGLGDTGQPIERIKQLHEKSEYRIYTPGSAAGLSLSILQSFTAPRGNILLEDLNQKIDATAAALLGLTGISADPIQSREHIFIANLLKHAWTDKPPRDLDLPTLIEWIQTPPITQVGALELDKFYKEKDRMKLAVALNNILAAPSFETWLQGDPLDLTTLLARTPGKAQQLIFSVAHLDDSQRMFFITLLLAEVLSWTRKQSGSSSLRAILYFDEVFGYLPPHPASPPSKPPMMTLLKQARAFGVGILLATQNPVDVDYKALSNAGTWFVGKLQTERDKARLLDGLDSAAAERGSRTNRAEIEQTIAALGNRVFLLHNIHRGAEPVVFQTRWAQSYLRGPMMREEIARLMAPLKAGQQHAPIPVATVALASASATVVAAPSPAPVLGSPVASMPPPLPPPTSPASLAAGAAAVPPMAIPVTALAMPVSAPAPVPAPAAPARRSTSTQPVVAGVTPFFVPVRGAAPAGAALLYQGFLLGWADVVGENKKMGRKYPRSLRLLAAAPPDGQQPDWKKAEQMHEGLDAQPRADARWSDISSSLTTLDRIEAFKKGFGQYLTAVKLTVPACPKLSMTCDMGEDVEVFRVRCQKEAWKEFQKQLAAEKETYASEFARYKVAAPAPLDPASGASWEEWWKPLLPGSPILRCTLTAALSAKDKEQLDNLEREWHALLARHAEALKKAVDQLGELPLTVKKGDSKITQFGLAWVPFWLPSAGGPPMPAYRA